MMQTAVVKATNSSNLQHKINEALKGLVEANIVDVKLTSYFDGKVDNYMALIMYTI